MKQLHSHTQKNQRGAVIVEMALILPILLVFFVGIIDFGLILREYQILQNAAREGARMSMLQRYELKTLGATDQATVTAAIQQRVVDYLAQEHITIASSDVLINQDYAIDLGGGLSASASQITVNYTRSMLIGNGWPFGPVALKGEAIYANLY
jgi:Flp pilus assembly protein TadG